MKPQIKQTEIFWGGSVHCRAKVVKRLPLMIKKALSKGIKEETKLVRQE